MAELGSSKYSIIVTPSGIFFLLAALTLQAMPLIYQLQWLWPHWPALVLLCWGLERRHGSVNMWVWGGVGLVVDILTFAPLGQQMIAYAVMGWIDQRMGSGRNERGQRNNLYRTVQRALATIIFLQIYLLLFNAFSGSGLQVLNTLGVAATSVLVAPLLCYLIPSRNS